MLASVLAHGGDASGLGMLAFFPIGILLLIGIVIALRPAMTGTPPGPTEEDDQPVDAGPETDERPGRS